MAWYEEVKDLPTFTAFVNKFLGRDRDSVHKVNFIACVLTTMGMDFKGKAPLQCKDADERTMEICIQFCENSWFNAATAKAMVQEVGKTAGRDAQQFREKKEQAEQLDYNMRGILRTELVPCLRSINPEIEQLWQEFKEKTGGTYEGATEYEEKVKAVINRQTEQLRELRKHQKIKVNKHKAGLFVLFTNMVDDEPLLLVSSGFKKQIDEGYLQLARESSTKLTKKSAGRYRQAGKALTEFDVVAGTATDAHFRDAFKALRATRSALVVAPGSIDPKSTKDSSDEEDDLPRLLNELGKVRAEQKAMLKKAECGQFWLAEESHDGDPLIVVTNDLRKKVGNLDALRALIVDEAAVATGKWTYNSDGSIYYDFDNAKLSANVVADSIKATRLTCSANPVKDKSIEEIHEEATSKKKKK